EADDPAVRQAQIDADAGGTSPGRRAFNFDLLEFLGRKMTLAAQFLRLDDDRGHPILAHADSSIKFLRRPRPLLPGQKDLHEQMVVRDPDPAAITSKCADFLLQNLQVHNYLLESLRQKADPFQCGVERRCTEFDGS